MSKVCILQHLECEDLGLIANALEFFQVEPSYIKTHEGQTVPQQIDSFNGLIVMGGPMGVYEQDRYPFLRDEIRLIQDAIRKNKPILGVCLGSQLLAAALGANVRKGVVKELGWHSVSLTGSAVQDQLWKDLPSQFMGFHWHGDVFDLPKGAVHLASSSLAPFQSFRYGESAYGLLFHLEMTKESIKDMVLSFRNELIEACVEGSDILRRVSDYLPGLKSIGEIVFQRWAGLIKS